MIGPMRVEAALAHVAAPTPARAPQCPGHDTWRGRCDRDCLELVQHGVVYYAWACHACASAERDARRLVMADHQRGMRYGEGA